MYFETLDDPALMELADAIVAELGIEHFFNIQLVGEHVIEINPRISTVVYQEDLNLPYLGVKRAHRRDLGRRAAGTAGAGPRRAGRRCAYFDQLEWGRVCRRPAGASRAGSSLLFTAGEQARRGGNQPFRTCPGRIRGACSHPEPPPAHGAKEA